jgi:ABC-type branched-subunit amino acid transport system substrate-binding protein
VSRLPSGLARWVLAGPILAAALCAAPSAPAAEAPPPAAVLLEQPPAPARDRALLRWSKRASLAELMHALRLPSERLGRAEGPLIEAALAHTHRDRVALERRLLARLARVAPDARLARTRKAAAARAAVPRPFGSVFVVGAVLPDSGDYESYGRAVLAGLRAGLADSAGPATPPVDVVARASGSEDAAATVAAFDAVLPGAGLVVGELLSVPTLVLAAATRYAGVPLISPTATDESVGSVGGDVFQIGPSAFERGATLAAAVLDGRPARIGMLRSSAASASFAAGFAAAAESAGARVVWNDTYAPGNGGFRDHVQALAANRVDVVFWDGEPREAEALARQLGRERLTVRLCGGRGLAPEQHHSTTRSLFEGAQYVGEDWEPGPALAARLYPDPGTRSELDLRGYLAGRMIRAALAAGALCPEEVADQLRWRTGLAPTLRARGFLAVGREGVTLPVYRVQRGLGVVR